MIRSLRRRFFTVRHAYLNPIDRQRASVLLVINWTIMLAVIAWLLTGVVPLLLTGDEVPLQGAVALALTLTLNIVIFRQIQTGRLRNAGGLFVTILAFNIILLTVTLQETGSTSISGGYIIALAIPLVAAGVLLNRRGMLLVAAALVTAIIFAVIGQSQNTASYSYIPAESWLIDLPIAVISLGLILTFLLVFTGNLERIATESLSDIQQRQWITEFGIELGNLVDENRVLSRALDVVRDRFQYIYAQAYLVDEEGRLSRVIRAGSNQIEAVSRDVAAMSDASIIFEALRTKAPAITTGDESLPRRSHLISAATFGVAIPLHQGDVVLGVLDVQSARSTSFSQNEIRVLELLADQLGIALQHSRTVNDLERNLREQESANVRLQRQVSEYLQRERRGVGNAWGQYLEGRGKTAIGYNVEPDNTTTPVPATDIPETLYTTLQEGTLQVDTSGDEQIINVPIRFRDQTLGAMSFALPQGQTVSDRQIEMARIVAERLALALENTRLFEQSQAQAFRERKASEVSSVLIGATDVPSVLNLAAENFNEALGAIHTRIYIQPGFLSEPLAETPQNEEAR
jgi:GAF domain-containing protein